MATWEDVERIAAGLPEVTAGLAWGRPAYLVHGRWFVLARAPEADAVDDHGQRLKGLIVLWVEDQEEKHRLAADDSGYFLTTPHFAKERMILAHLNRMPVDELAEVLIESWLVRAPKRAQKSYLQRLDHTPDAPSPNH